MKKLTLQHKEAKNALTYDAIKFQLIVTILIYAFIYATLILWSFYYRTTPAFFLPPGFSGPLDRLFAFPGSPPGSVSTFMWLMSCKRICGFLTRKILKTEQGIDDSQDFKGGNPFNIQTLMQATTTVLPPETQVS